MTSGLRALVVDLLATGTCVAAACLELALLDGTQVAVLPVLTIVVMSLPVLLRRRRPVTAFVLSMVLIFGVLSTSDIYNTIGFPAVLCAYALASAYGRRVAVVAGLASIPLVMLMLQGYSPHALLGWDTLRNLALLVLPLALGVATHERRASTKALLERAEAAERTREVEASRRVGEERLRIARDVHDVVAHAMVAINVQAGVGAHLLNQDPERARTTLREIKRLSGEALGDLRSMLGLLRPTSDPADGGTSSASVDRTGGSEPPPLRPLQRLARIEDLREQMHAAGVHLDLDIDPTAATLPAALDAAGYRIAQEALTNVMRHAGPTRARVRVTRHPDRVEVEIEDDGGTPPAPLHTTGSGNGIRGMHERAAAVGGELEAGPRVRGGWRVAASLPLDQASVQTPS